MVKANSLLYAIYICLIVSILCGALLYFSNLYGQLNVYYNLQEELYIHNQSVVNYALGNAVTQEDFPEDEKTGTKGSYAVKQYGLLSLLLAKSVLRNDTIASAHLVGCYNQDKTAIHLANFTKALSYTGTVKIVGENKLPLTTIETSYINNKPNNLTVQGKTEISEINLPEINPDFKKMFDGTIAHQVALSDLEKVKDSMYFNSFFNETKEVNVPSVLSNIIFKGNFILHSKDSIRIKNSAVLEDVIIIAPKITFEEGFSGNVQAFAITGIEMEQKVTLHYPSVLCVYNKSADQSLIRIKKGAKLTGAIVLFGNPLEYIDKNIIEIETEGLIYGDVYCTGKLDLKSKVYGSVYTNRFFLKTETSTYDNTIADIEINAMKRANYFIAIPLFKTQKKGYGVLKKVL